MSAAALKPVRDLSLYELSSEWDQLMSSLAESGGEITPEIEAQFTAINDGFESKVESCALFIRTQEGLAATAKAESERLSDLAHVRYQSAESLKRMVRSLMEHKGQLKVVRPLARVSVVNVGGKLRVSSVWDTTPEEIPADYRKCAVFYSLDKEKVLVAHDMGLPLPTGITVHERSKRLSIA